MGKSYDVCYDRRKPCRLVYVEVGMSAEKENVFRTLRDEELYVTYWGCRFGIHKWLKYREPSKATEGYYSLTVQERRCGSCNITDRRIISKS